MKWEEEEGEEEEEGGVAQEEEGNWMGMLCLQDTKEHSGDKIRGKS